MTDIIFYTKPGCHLCEDGQWMLEVALRSRSYPVNFIDITADADLIERYGDRIPVLRRLDLSADPPTLTDPPELDWPFTPEDILAWLVGKPTVNRKP